MVQHGNNSIIVIPGANDLLSEQDVMYASVITIVNNNNNNNNNIANEHAFQRDASDAIASCSVLLCQNEIPLATTKQALSVGKDKGLTTIFNVAPAPDSLPDDVLSYV
jgi:sugar/nucleoside kinase (ribokinase family)